MGINLSPAYIFLMQVFFILLLPWATYWEAMRGDWVSDDWAGLVYSDESRTKLYLGELRKPLSFHNLLRWIRWHAGKVPNPDKDWKRKKLPQFLCSALKHHRLNIILFSGSSVLLFLFLSKIIDPTLAFLTTILFMVHPCGAQTVAWMSGIGYLLSFFLMLTGLNIAVLTQGWLATSYGFLGGMGLFAIFQFLAVQAMFSAWAATAILVFLGMWPYAIVSAIISLLFCAPTLRDAVKLREKVFKEQKMGESTTLHPRKIVVVGKTFWYYLKLMFFPKRLGLYHVFGYHYELPYIEQEDKYFWMGVGLLVVLGAAFWAGPFPVKLAICWLVAFLVLFLNWITVHQFVTERYCWMPTVGVCLLVTWGATALHLNSLYWLIFGIALMRTWAHIPTYYNETQFYLSNVWNFPNSEVALGNLGVIHLSRGLIGTAMENWASGGQVNPEYDVNWYNISSLLRARGPLNPYYAPAVFSTVPADMQKQMERTPQLAHLLLARHFLVRATSARSCHFPELWEKEMRELDMVLAQAMGKPLATNDFKPLPAFLHR